MKLESVFFITLATACASQPASAMTALYDHFDDGSLDPSWQIAFTNASGWSCSEAGTNLTVTDIDSTVVNSGGGGEWARVTLSRTFSHLSDFQIDFDFSWDSEGSIRAEQGVGMRLLDPVGNTVASASYRDAWVAQSGTRDARIGETTYSSGFGTAPLSGVAEVDMKREEGSTDILWDGIGILSGTHSEPIAGVELSYWYYANTVSGGPSFFGSESIDLVNIQGTPVPIPPSIWLFAPFAFALAFVRLRNRRDSV